MNTSKLKIVFTLCALTPMAVWAGDSIDQSWTVDSDVRISIENVAGEIEVNGWDRNEVRLTGKLGDSVDELEVNASSSRLQIAVLNRDERNIDETVLILKST